MVNAQIRVGQDLVKPKSINVFRDGEWQQKRVGYVFKNGEWVPFIQYLLTLYKNGEEFTPFVEGYSNTSAQNRSFVKGINAYDLTVIRANNILHVESEIKVDVSDFKTLKMTCYNDGANRFNYAIIGASNTSKSSTLVAETSEYINSLGDEFAVSLDISSLSGEFYIITGMKAGALSAATYKLKITNIWLE